MNLIREGRLSDSRSTDSNDILSSLRLVPKFNERKVETFFTLFERVADARGCSDADCVILLQSALTGRAQEALSLLTAPDSGDYSKVKAAVLKVYELVLKRIDSGSGTGGKVINLIWSLHAS